MSAATARTVVEDRASAGRAGLARLRAAWARLAALGLQHELPLSYASLVFSRSRAVGLLLLLATCSSPRHLLGGLLGILAASATARLLTLDVEARREGSFGYNALLCGLGMAHTFAGPWPLVLLVLLIAPACTLLTAALKTSLAARALPVLSWPFLILFTLILGLPAHSGGLLEPAIHDPAAAGFFGLSELFAALPLPLAVEQYLRGLGALFFTPEPLAGLLLLLGLLAHSRIAALLATLGFTVALCLNQGLSLPAGALIAVLGYNTAFTAMALGGVWFVPSPASFFLALFGAALCVFLVAGAQPPYQRLGIPIMVLPFNLVVTLILLALRQRIADRSPKLVDFIPGTPEQNLSYFRTRLQRFRWLYAVRFQLPFRGVWLCTQAVDGSHTHKGRWRHAYDFEVRGADGLLFHGDGSQPENYHAFKLPVLATARGTVVKVVNHIADNPIGALNLNVNQNENWGNLVLLWHGPGLYSLVAHLARGSVRVYEGQLVQAGELLGLCGSSGRSPQPHVHFHLQGTHLLGEGTLPCRFNDVVVQPKASALAKAGAALATPLIDTALDPRQGDELRNLEPSAEAAAFLAFFPGGEWIFQAQATAEVPYPLREHIVSEVDLYGQRALRSREYGTRLYYELGDLFFTVFDVVGEQASLLHLLRMALPRVPFEATEALRWRDHLPARPLRTFAQRMLGDFVSPFFHQDSIEVELGLRREDKNLIITGESLRHERGGGPLLRTRTVLAPDGAPLRLEVTLRGRTMTLARVPFEDVEPSGAAAALASAAK